MDRDEAARQVTESVAALFFSAENQSRFHGASDELGISPPMLKALLELAPGEGMPMRDLAERWGCDASFVTVTCDGLEERGLVRRRVAQHDRRVKMVELTREGVEARSWATGEVYGPRAGFDALTPDEQITLATLLRRLADAQAAHDEAMLDQPGMRSMARRISAQRRRELRGRGGLEGGGWKEHFEAHHREIRKLKEELARVRAEIKLQARRPVDEAKAAKDDVKAELKAARDDVVNHLRGGRRRR